MDRTIKLILAVILLICLFDMPYGYYQFVRFSSMVGFGYLAYIANEKKEGNLILIYIALALLFQPFYKVALGRTIWNVVDVVVAGWLVLGVFREKMGNGSKDN